MAATLRDCAIELLAALCEGAAFIVDGDRALETTERLVATIRLDAAASIALRVERHARAAASPTTQAWGLALADYLARHYGADGAGDVGAAETDALHTAEEEVLRAARLWALARRRDGEERADMELEESVGRYETARKAWVAVMMPADGEEKSE